MSPIRRCLDKRQPGTYHSECPAECCSTGPGRVLSGLFMCVSPDQAEVYHVQLFCILIAKVEFFNLS